MLKLAHYGILNLKTDLQDCAVVCRENGSTIHSPRHEQTCRSFTTQTGTVEIRLHLTARRIDIIKRHLDPPAVGPDQLDHEYNEYPASICNVLELGSAH